MIMEPPIPTSSRSKSGAARENDRLRRLQRLVIQGELAATAVHEISNLQTIVLFNAALLRERHKGNPEVIGYVEPLLHAANMIATMCSQLRHLAHPVEAQAQVMDLAAVCEGACRLLEKIIGRKLVFEPGRAGPVLVVADPSQVEQMLINLVMNSRDATPPEEGVIIVRVGPDRETRRPWLEVEDNGTGMPPRVKARLFTKFFTTKPAGHGTGLGLVTVRRLLEAMDGRVVVHSRVGRGTRIRLVFAAPSPAQAAAYVPPVFDPRLPNMPGQAFRPPP